MFWGELISFSVQRFLIHRRNHFTVSVPNFPRDMRSSLPFRHTYHRWSVSITSVLISPLPSSVFRVHTELASMLRVFLWESFTLAISRYFCYQLYHSHDISIFSKHSCGSQFLENLYTVPLCVGVLPFSSIPETLGKDSMSLGFPLPHLTSSPTCFCTKHFPPSEKGFVLDLDLTYSTAPSHLFTHTAHKKNHRILPASRKGSFSPEFPVSLISLLDLWVLHR